MGAVLSQLARCPTSQWVGFRKKREGHIKARPEGVHCGAGLGHHRLSQLEGLGAEGWVETEDQMVPSPIPLRGHRAALSSGGFQAEEEAGLIRADGVVAGALNGSQDPAVRVRDRSSHRVHEHLETTTPALGDIKARSPVAAATTGASRRLRVIFWELPRLGETRQELRIQPAGPALGGTCPGSGRHCQAEKGEDSQKDEEPRGRQCQPEGLSSPRLHVATRSRGWGKQEEQGLEGESLELESAF